jgi:Flp pilus assembly protein TadD
VGSTPADANRPGVAGPRTHRAVALVRMPLPRRIAGVLLALAALAASADELADIRRLQDAGDRAGALALAERALAAHPEDTRLRFARAVILAEAGRSDEAIAALRALNQEHPELAEPYNNLAALLAERGEVEAARTALENAIRARPDYAIAHENLGDVLVTLAARSYAEAARLDPANRSAPVKLQLARTLLQAAARP